MVKWIRIIFLWPFNYFSLETIKKACSKALKLTTQKNVPPQMWSHIQIHTSTFDTKSSLFLNRFLGLETNTPNWSVASVKHVGSSLGKYYAKNRVLVEESWIFHPQRSMYKQWDDVTFPNFGASHIPSPPQPPNLTKRITNVCLRGRKWLLETLFINECVIDVIGEGNVIESRSGNKALSSWGCWAH